MRSVQFVTNACLRKTPIFVLQQVCAVFTAFKTVFPMPHFNLFFKLQIVITYFENDVDLK